MGLEGPVPFICECAEETCMAIVRLTMSAYEDVRQRPRRFFNAPGHEALSVNAGAATVVERLPTHVIVDKIGQAGEVAESEYEELPIRGDDV
jgi:hypothetical protein